MAGDHGHAEVDLLALRAHREAAVLGAAALGNVHVAEDLDAADDGAFDGLGQGHDGRHDAVEAQTGLDAVLERLDVQVRRAGLDGLHEDLVDQIDDGGLVVVALLVVDRLDAFRLALAHGARDLEGLVHELARRAAAVERVEGGAHVLFLEADADDHQAGQVRDLIEQLHVVVALVGVGGAAVGDHQALAEPHQRHDLLLARDGLRDERQHVFFHRELGQAGDAAQNLLQLGGALELLVGDEALLDQGVFQASAGLLADLLRDGQLTAGDHAQIDEPLANQVLVGVVRGFRGVEHGCPR
ncbi:hypothetical protein D3C72_766660 [compost metagenome]